MTLPSIRVSNGSFTNGENMNINFVSNIPTRGKLILGFTIVNVLILLVAILGYRGISTINGNLDSTYNQELVVIDKLDTINTDIAQIRGDVYKFMQMPDQKEAMFADYNKNTEEIDAFITLLQTKELSPEGSAMFEEFVSQWAEYKAATTEVMDFVDKKDTASALASLESGGRVFSVRAAMDENTTGLQKLTHEQADLGYQAAVASFQQTRNSLIVGVLVSLILAVLIVVIISQNISKPMKVVTNGLHTLMVGSATVTIDDKTRKELTSRKDEFGDLVKAVIGTRGYFTEMSDVAEAIANNDLSMTVQTKSPDDKLGNTLLKMVNDLHATISEVARASISVQEASSQLAIASNQSGQATSQISTTIQQVANGTTQQAEAVNQTASSVEQMGRAIDGVAKGAQEQASATAKAFSLTNQLSEAIAQVSGNINQMVNGSNAAADAAKRGNQTVNQTLTGMESIKTAVDLSAQKVQEMGSRSDQIGTIVTTIEDIASQTNLLALNAAIEAARAGDAGKGFAVVADEVRKLAERSSSSTKEIADLIKDIQRTVAEAVDAMNNGSKEVEMGVTLANQSGAALQEILSTNEDVNVQAKEAAAAAENMASSASELVAAVDTVSAVVEENTAATEEMAANSSEVTQAIENIASVSEENSAAVEEVSASAEEMNAQVEEVSASAQELSDLAVQLENIVKKFKLE
jgi:methyl-accepting chemotaxis protein